MDNKDLNLAIANNEATLLGLLLREPKSFFDISEIIKPKMFHFIENQILYNTISEVNLKSKNFDIANLLDYLVKQKLINKIGRFNLNGAEYLQWLIKNAGYYSELQTYTKNLIDQYKTDQLMMLFKTNLANIENKAYDVNELINKIQFDLININVSEINSSYESLGNKVNEVINDILKDKTTDTSIGLNLGFEPLDNLLSGANQGDLIIIASRPAMGKTAFALNIASNVAQNDKNVLFFSLEMSSSQLVQRIIAIESMVELYKLRKNLISTDEWKEIHWTRQAMSEWPLYLADKPSLTLSDLLTLSKRFAQTKKVDLIVIDYLQLIADSNRANNENRQIEISKISRALKQLARELKCPIIALSQLSRNVEKREDKTPILSDLRESGSIEQDADIVIFLHRKDYYNKKKEYTEESENNSLTNVIVAKNRHGAVGLVRLLFKPQINRFFYEKTSKGEILNDKNN
ncbi:replicative DNA helicase [Metamycoplasma buccale]|uniref:replicative DNA helicase n=1 Tax=Metamycoplasma buccale TaxID=55602 RepID=UPI00398E3C22